jgi:hypothetical protein
MRHVAVVVIIAGLGLAGCGGFHEMASDRCDGKGPCHVEVSVYECKATAKPDVLPVTGKNIIITWELDAFSAQYEFRPNDGIALKTDSPEFTLHSAGNKRYMLHDKNSLPHPPNYSYPYRINVQKKASGGPNDCPTTDPTIVNQG